MQQKELQLLIISFSIVLFTLLMFVFVLFFFFYKKKSQYILDKLESELIFQSELAKSALEIKEETMNSFSRELHDNVGQLLSVAVMQLNISLDPDRSIDKSQINNVKGLVEKSLNEIRVISKLINGEIQLSGNFTEVVNEDLKRINQLKNIHGELIVKGEPVIIKNEHEIIIYRMIQECISNILKHSHSDKIEVTVDYNNVFCHIEVKDYGKGFDVLKSKLKGFGLNSMMTRAKLINAEFDIKSELNKGSQMIIKYPLNLIN